MIENKKISLGEDIDESAFEQILKFIRTQSYGCLCLSTGDRTSGWYHHCHVGKLQRIYRKAEEQENFQRVGNRGFRIIR